jgi:hypothetical protein
VATRTRGSQVNQHMARIGNQEAGLQKYETWHKQLNKNGMQRWDMIVWITEREPQRQSRKGFFSKEFYSPKSFQSTSQNTCKLWIQHRDSILASFLKFLVRGILVLILAIFTTTTDTIGLTMMPTTKCIPYYYWGNPWIIWRHSHGPALWRGG